MKKIKIKAPCKINLNLKITGTLEGNFHALESIMQTVNLCDYLTLVKIESGIKLDGTKKDVLAYDETNIVYKAAKLFFETSKINKGVEIYVEKNIPLAAGLAGGSTDAAGCLYGLNKLFDEPLSQEGLLELCEKLGSDLNFCLIGGRALVKGRGEKIEPLKFEPFDLTIVKPKSLGISAKEAYQEFDKKEGSSNMDNDLEWALLSKYKELQYLNSLGLTMSGSGSAYFKTGEFNKNLDPDMYEIYKDLKAVPYGVCEV